MRGREGSKDVEPTFVYPLEEAKKQQLQQAGEISAIIWSGCGFFLLHEREGCAKRVMKKIQAACCRSGQHIHLSEAKTATGKYSMHMYVASIK